MAPGQFGPDSTLPLCMVSYRLDLELKRTHNGPNMTDLYRQLPLTEGVDPAGMKIATSVAFTEGPAVDATGNVYFSEIENNRIFKLAPDGARSVFRQPSHRTNGQTIDRQGRIYHCEGAEFGPGGGRRIFRSLGQPQRRPHSPRSVGDTVAVGTQR